MKKAIYLLIRLVLFFILLPIRTHAQNIVPYFLNSLDNQALSSYNSGEDFYRPSYAGRIVEVIGAKKGNGVFILVGNKPMILTNSHLVQGQNFVLIDLQKRPFIFNNRVWRRTIDVSLHIRVKVARDFPAYDFALLDLPDDLDKDLLLVLRYYGIMNAKICKDGLEFCGNDLGLPAGIVSKNSHVDAIIDGDRISSALEEGFHINIENDRLVSGLFTQVLTIPNFSPLGVSGGAFYFEERFKGLVTRVSSNLEATTIAIPIEQIVGVLSGAISGNNLHVVNANWVKPMAMATSRLEISIEYLNRNNTLTKELLISSAQTNNTLAAGGPTGSAGGPTGSAGGPTPNNLSNFFGSNQREPYTWFLKLPDDNHHASNPFIIEPSVLIINGRRLETLKINGNDYHPNLVNYLWGRRVFPANVEVGFSPLINLEKSEPLKYGRLYQKKQVGFLNLINPSCDTIGGDFAQALDPKFDLNPQKISCSDKVDLKSSFKDAEGFYVGNAFKAKLTENFILDVKFKENGKYIYFRIPTDLGKITLSEDNNEITFRSYQNASNYRILIASDGKSRVVLTFDSQSIRQVERVILETDSSLAEFFYCRPSLDPGCFR